MFKISGHWEPSKVTAEVKLKVIIAIFEFIWVFGD